MTRKLTSATTNFVFLSIITYHDSRATDETFTFSDGTTFTKTGGTYGGTDVTWSAPFTAWKTGQPAADTIASQDCVRTDTNGKWDDVGCSTKKFNYACQIPAGNPGQSITLRSRQYYM